VCRSNLGPDNPDTRFQAPIRSRTLFYSKPESGVHVTEMMPCDWSIITADIFTCCEVVVCSVVIKFVYLRPQPTRRTSWKLGNPGCELVVAN